LSNAAERSAEIILYRIPQKNKGVLAAKSQFVEPQIGWGKFLTGGVKGVNIFTPG
jgi:hypothetical protein